MLEQVNKIGTTKYSGEYQKKRIFWEEGIVSESSRVYVLSPVGPECVLLRVLVYIIHTVHLV